MPVLTLAVGPLKTNCYLFYHQKNKNALIIDPGDDADLIIEQIKKLKLKPQGILATHGHFDHILAINELKKKFTNLPFYLNKKDSFILNSAPAMAKFFIKKEIKTLPKVNHFLKNDQSLNISGLSLKIIETPGHTPGSVVLYSEKEQLAFTGDTIFADGYYGRTDLEGSDAKILKQSLGKIFKLPKNTVLYPGHGASTTVKEALEYF
ncbi:MAG: MBL fold metallo-hydrolase [Candidatus Woesebacteria bacterium]|jgi:glyoxylase-like metal-dependent hydrolase (beta-lactamase superfamily II)